MIRAFDHSHYVPSLRWKMGEYQALYRLSEDSKGAITPLIEIPEIGWDFENKEDAKDIVDHLKNFPARIKKKWGKRDCFLDFQLVEEYQMPDGIHPIAWVHSKIPEIENHVVWVTGVNRHEKAYEAISKIVSKNKKNLAIRLSLSNLGSPTIQADLKKLMARFLMGPHEIHLIVDLQAPSFEPLDGFGKMLSAFIPKIPSLKEWVTFTLTSTAFPKSGDLQKGVHSIPRNEWLIYQRILSGDIRLPRTPTFGDYCIAHPEVMRLDMRKMKPSASVRYTRSDNWLIIKGAAYRDEPSQFTVFAQQLVASKHFLGDSFSAGDAHIKKCAQGSEGHGNLSTWRWIGTNHHIEKVIYDLADLSEIAASA